MCFRLALALIGTTVFPSASLAQQTTPPTHALLATPNTCVALRQGRTCYSDIELQWQVANDAAYCIREQTKQQPLHCWQGQRQGYIIVDFASPKAVRFELFPRASGETIADTEVRVQWVYTNGQKKRRWRLF
ncbi:MULTISPECIES: DUF3019 domain-containing protein [Pseudoalteromonas]|uniref:DUF3019 domain-containing protein n=1 Tax=Pseudoalteromonas ruthenica TaxID=151081 RepID=A0A0F4PZG7_9GAMM|nr:MULTISPECIES: DUF3019 domain-containing protein [Pseudoalteromonas]KJZ00813.1 hypothetical protein TW76_00965 [Pseudoalteromonas ruthenica]KJZ01134.1 hypothetical protein TW72_04640 [Pseudoalteromonas ruthenica]MCF2863092.1 DUF3019 domain-containing protein [Pseudoalteromonas sp. CNAT2-18]MCG7559244.1 DUF3019 domain-containing protein [Pseudoalteromonas sp. CNAT2-18.1]MCG7571313.1 DUF3019 domain-containing protein [Pseudoalteromonas sp. CNC9-20]